MGKTHVCARVYNALHVARAIRAREKGKRDLFHRAVDRPMVDSTLKLRPQSVRLISRP